MLARVATLERRMWWIGAMGALAALGFFALAFDQGQMLSLALGDASYQMNLLHELVHDARHVAGFPCH